MATTALTCACRCLCRVSASAAAAAAVVPSTSHSPSTDAVGRLEFDASKAGLQKVDKAYVEKVIQDSTRGSAFYQSEQRKEGLRCWKIESLVAKQRQFLRLSAEEQHVYKARAKAVEKELEASRSFSRCFIHVDIDMFYAAVEEKLDPSLREQPFAVGSYAMLATSNYVARTYGVRSGMPGFIAKKLCPALRIRPLKFDLYRREAAAVRSIGAEYDPHYVTVGLDELTMDVTEYLRTHPDRLAEDVCAEFRRRVEEVTQLTCSGGISHTAAFAKLASNVNKPNGQYALYLRTRDEVLAHVKNIPVREMPGVGFATEKQLRALGIVTCKDFLKHKTELCYLFREKTFTFYLSIGLGLVHTHVDRRNAERTAATAPCLQTPPSSSALDQPATELTAAVLARVAQKSASKCLTLMRGIPSRQAYWKHLRQLTKGAHAVLEEQSTATKHLSFHTTDRNFLSHSHSTMLPAVTNNFSVIHAALVEMARPFAGQHRQFRLIGVRFNKLQPLPTGTQTTRSKVDRQNRVQRHAKRHESVTASVKKVMRERSAQVSGDAHRRPRTKPTRRNAKGALCVA
ncbi:hypothetical protein JKF63_03565 [Porcisia hertigi]|uniref:DNA polymerase kappa n=1 Tax=Porcisia hertigi TaxID=2761500 RepID=A0A836HIE8_9TRYP|nr:hypothetical protein JKF63_03565 [Porcisia hertigi]